MQPLATTQSVACFVEQTFATELHYQRSLFCYTNLCIAAERQEVALPEVMQLRCKGCDTYDKELRYIILI